MSVRPALVLFCALLFPPALETLADPVSRPSVVKFNTVCIRCHEGECSGRLSFDSGASGAWNHVRRYLPSATAPEIEELFAIIRYTKERCALYPVTSEVPAGRVWREADLSRWRGPGDEGYFVPLGILAPGAYRLELHFDVEAEGSARVESDTFDTRLTARLCPGTRFSLELPVEDESPLSLLVQSRAKLLELRLGARE